MKWLAVLFLLAGLSGQARATCPSPMNLTVQAGGSVLITCENAFPDFGFYDPPEVAPSHGSLTFGDNTNIDNVRYQNDGTGTTDTFTLKRGSDNTLVVFNVTIQQAPSPITIAPSALSFSIATPYNQSLTATGGTGPYSFAVTSGALPTGMSLASDGSLSGIPSGYGTYTFGVTATDANSVTGSRTYSGTVPYPTITIAPASLPAPAMGVAYSAQLSSTGGLAPYTYTKDSGALPPGLNLTGTGVVSGTPTTTGTYTFTVLSTDSSTDMSGALTTGSAIRTYAVTVSNIASPVAHAVSATVDYDSSSNPITLNITGGTPTSVAVDTQAAHGTATASGTSIVYTPNSAYLGSDSFAYTASNAGGTSASATVSITVNPPTAPVANPVSTTVAYDSTSNVVPTSFTGGTPNSVAIASPASHGTATASGTTITYTPTVGYTGPDSFTYTGTNAGGTSAPATVSITVSEPTLVISSSSGGTSLTATVGQSFTQTFTFSGGKAPYSGYSVTGIPAGLSVTGFNSTSITISGTPTASGTFTLGVGGTDSSTGTNAPFTVNQSFTLTINTASMSLSPSTLPDATTSTAYNQTITASGGVAPYSYAMTAGALPAGTSLSPSGVLSGTPTAGGVFHFTVTATDSSTGAGSPATVSVAYTLNVAPPTITLTPASLPNAQRGSSYSQNLSASGGLNPYTYAVTSGSLPAGLGLSPGGALSGTPTASGTFNFTVTATDSSAGSGPYTGSRTYALTVASPTITVTPVTLPASAVGSAYSQTLIASGGSSPYTYAVTSGTLPNGLNLSSSGTLSGTPTAGGSFTFVVTATDSSGAGGPYTGTRTYNVTVATPTITVTPASLPAGQQGTAYSQSLAANGGTAPYTFAVTSGTLPNGLSLSGNGALSGTPTVSGSFNFTITATDSSTGSGPYDADLAYSLNVVANPPVAADDTVSTPWQQAVSIDVTGNDNGQITSVAIDQPPAHGSAVVNGLLIVYTPNGSTTGADTFTYTATGPGGTSTPATVTVRVALPPYAAVPTLRGLGLALLIGLLGLIATLRLRRRPWQA